MDLRDHRLGISPDFFWFRAKRGLIRILLERAPGKGGRILNVGAGVGEDMSVISAYGAVHVVDTEPESIRLIPESLVAEKRVCDACALDYPDGFFDIALAFDTLEHIGNDRRAVQEMTRVLRPGGTLIVSVPAFNFLFSAHDRVLGHHRRYTMRSLNALMSGLERVDAGFWTFSLFFPLAAQRLANRKKDMTRYFELPRWVDGFFYWLLNVENKLIERGCHLPVGTSIYCVWRKPEK